MTSAGSPGPDWAADAIDPQIPSPARIYDYFLGGFANFDIDRRIAARLSAILPDAARIARANRALLRRVVRHMLDAGIDQFLDLGSGIPAAGSVHEMAWAVNPLARVAYVDIDPVAVTMSRRQLGADPRATAVRGDLIEIDEILENAQIRGVLDFRRPIAALLIGVLHRVHDDVAAERLGARLYEVMAPGSRFAISQIGRADDGDRGERIQAVNRIVIGKADRLRSPAEIAALLSRFTLVPPGVARVSAWHAEPEQPAPAPPVLDGYVAVGLRE
ncbi:SAM-dependent methyltransferase [Nocardia stercoris]|uniref:SAM-dependent methyltransferase n=1 Tax=Nocardia stercoris TaxID=2483361 RepID=UPI00131A2F4A|nr:SAM-dependent methyltransferase [Nocardia stercoris]